MSKQLDGWTVFTSDDDGRGSLVKIKTASGNKSLIALPTAEANRLVDAMKQAGATDPVTSSKGTTL